MEKERSLAGVPELSWSHAGSGSVLGRRGGSQYGDRASERCQVRPLTDHTESGSMQGGLCELQIRFLGPDVGPMTRESSHFRAPSSSADGFRVRARGSDPGPGRPWPPCGPKQRGRRLSDECDLPSVAPIQLFGHRHKTTVGALLGPNWSTRWLMVSTCFMPSQRLPTGQVTVKSTPW